MRLRRSRLSEEQTELLLRSFVAGTAARRAAESSGVNRHTARLFYHRLRQLIARHLPRIGGQNGTVQFDTKGKRCCDPRPVPLFGVIDRAGRIYTVMLPRAPQSAAPRRALRVDLDAVVCRWQVGRRATLRLVALQTRDAAGEGDESTAVREFWCRTQKQLGRFRGVPQQHLELYVKECEWRFNYGSEHRLLQTLRLWLDADWLGQ